MEEAGRHVVLIRAPKGPEDVYTKVLEGANFTVHFIKALHFESVNLELLASALEEKHAGLIFTSQTAVESTIHAISLIKGKASRFVDQWSGLPVFVVGKATAAAVEQLGLEAIGSVSGNAEILANTIVKCQEKSTLPLLFPCGNLAMDTVQTELEKAGLKLNRLVCYNTTREPHIEENLKALRDLQVIGPRCCITFFSPSGVEFVLPFLKLYCDLSILKVIAIGPTTAASLEQAGMSPVVAHSPNPDALLDALHNLDTVVS